MTGIIHAFLLDGRGGGEILDWDGVERWTAEAGTLWLSLDYSHAQAQAWLGLRSGIPPVYRDALLDRDPRPRVLVDDDALLLVVRGINLNQGAQPEDMVSVRCWVEPRRIVTLELTRSGFAPQRQKVHVTRAGESVDVVLRKRR